MKRKINKIKWWGKILNYFMPHFYEKMPCSEKGNWVAKCGLTDGEFGIELSIFTSQKKFNDKLYAYIYVRVKALCIDWITRGQPNGVWYAIVRKKQ